MAELEAEVLLLGIWKNIEELEEALNLDELKAIVAASREQRHEDRKFMAALKGIDLDEDKKQEAQDRFEKVQRRVQAKLTGQSEQKIALGQLAFDYEEG